uniref:Major facilitator superfamily (MFS) profile domain-containing protein n=1 Tax=Parascaris equorum TaxID=6256 RepID=A0A914RC19_PAREQ
MKYNIGSSNRAQRDVPLDGVCNRVKDSHSNVLGVIKEFFFWQYFILIFCSVIHESPHYLLQKGRLKEAIDVLTAITSWNNEPISSREIAELVAWEASKKNTAKTAITIKQNTYLDLYRTRTLAVHTIVTSFGFVAANCVTYSLVFNLSIIEGSLYVNTALSGALRYAIGIAIAVIDYTCVCAGRKIIHVGSVAVIVACLGGIVSLLHYGLSPLFLAPTSFLAVDLQ